MNVFNSYYYVSIIDNNEKQNSIWDIGKLDNPEYIKHLHEALDNFLQNIKDNYDLQDLQTEFIINLCVPKKEEED